MAGPFGILAESRAHGPRLRTKITFRQLRKMGVRGLLLGREVQPRDRKQRRSIARRCSALRYRAAVHLSGLRQERRRCSARLPPGKQATSRKVPGAWTHISRGVTLITYFMLDWREDRH